MDNVVDLPGREISGELSPQHDDKILVEDLLQDQVTSFLLSLPLGGSMQDAAVENTVGDHLIQIYREKAALEAKLNKW